MPEKEWPTAAFVLSLIGGLFIILGGGVMTIMGSFIGSFRYGMMDGYRRWGGMMSPGFGMMSFAFSALGIFGLIFGVIVMVSVILLNRRPAQHSTWGTLIVIFSVLSIFGSAMGGFGVGLILGLIGGVLAITWKPTLTKS
jgi:hypothetical protein